MAFFTPETKARTISGIFPRQLGDGLCHQAHLLGEPETTIDFLLAKRFAGPLDLESVVTTWNLTF